MARLAHGGGVPWAAVRYTKLPARREAFIRAGLGDGGLMATATTATATNRQPGLAGQTVVVIGGSAGIGLETARQARAAGADVVVTGRDAGRLQHAADELGARHSAAFDVNDTAALDRFFRDLPGQPSASGGPPDADGWPP